MFQISPVFTRDTVKTVFEAGLDAIASGQTAFDFSAVTAVDSSAVAALVAWQRTAMRRGAQLAFNRIPASLQSLIDLYGLDAALQRNDLPHH